MIVTSKPNVWHQRHVRHHGLVRGRSASHDDCLDSILLPCANLDLWSRGSINHLMTWKQHNMIQTDNKGTKRKSVILFWPQNTVNQWAKCWVSATEKPSLTPSLSLAFWICGLDVNPFFGHLCVVRPHESLKRLDNGLPHSSTCHWILPAKGVLIRPAVMSHHTHVNPLQGCQRRNHCCFDACSGEWHLSQELLGCPPHTKWAGKAMQWTKYMHLSERQWQQHVASSMPTWITRDIKATWKQFWSDRQIWLNMIMRIFKYIFFNSHQATPICTQEHVSYHHHTSAEHILKWQSGSRWSPQHGIQCWQWTWQCQWWHLTEHCHPTLAQTSQQKLHVTSWIEIYIQL